jgi:hypothetical protein
MQDHAIYDIGFASVTAWSDGEINTITFISWSARWKQQHQLPKTVACCTHSNDIRSIADSALVGLSGNTTRLCVCITCLEMCIDVVTGGYFD